MKDLSKEIKIIKIVSISIAVLTLIVGLFFSYMIAETEDAPGMVIIGSTLTLVGSSIVYGIGQIIIFLKKNNMLLSDIKKELVEKKK